VIRPRLDPGRELIASSALRYLVRALEDDPHVWRVTSAAGACTHGLEVIATAATLHAASPALGSKPVRLAIGPALEALLGPKFRAHVLPAPARSSAEPGPLAAGAGWRLVLELEPGATFSESEMLEQFRTRFRRRFPNGVTNA
jgi:hypothetical protein